MSKPFVLKALKPLTIGVTIGSRTFDVIVGLEPEWWILKVGALEIRWERRKPER